MSIIFTFGDVSSEPGVVTRTISVATDPDSLPGFFTAFQLNLAFDSSSVDILDWAIASADPQAIKVTNPATPELASDAGTFRLSGVSLNGLAPTTPFLTITYSHALALDPVFQFSNIIIDETTVSSSGVQTSYANPELGESAESGADGDANQSMAIVSVIDSDNGLTLYGLADGQVALSSVVASAGDSIEIEALNILKLSTNVPVDINAILASGLTNIEMETQTDNVVVDLVFSDGTTSTLSFSRESGLLNDSSSTTPEDEVPAGEGDPTSMTPVIADGVNLGSGEIDATGLEVLASDVENFFTVPADAIVVYRQRLDDAVAYEAMNSDSSIVGKFLGDSGSRTVANIKTGSLDFTLDAPAGVDLDILGLSGATSVSGATTYLNDLVDLALGDDPSVASWANSIKTSVAKMSGSHLGENIDLKVFTPTRTMAGTDEISIGAQSSETNVAALNLAVVDDLVTTTGFESLVAVGNGRLQISGMAPARVFGDSFSQEIMGGSGDDFISGGGGGDLLVGGSGSDTFELGFSGQTVLSDLSPEDTLQFSLFGVSNVDQLMSRFVSTSPGQQGLLVQFDDFSVELVGYTSLDQFASGLAFG